jgi:hypothetical protein
VIKAISENASSKIKWEGTIISIQPRTRVWRYVTDNRTHYHLGYNLFLEGDSGYSEKHFTVAISDKQQSKGLFRIGDMLKGTAWTKKYEEREFADFYRAGSLKLLARAYENLEAQSPPWIMVPPSMQTYEERGARMLSKSLWKTKCFQCIWANMANVEIQWDFDRDIKKYRFETFCYGPKSCKYYKMGRPRAVPYRNRDSALDEGYLDELCTPDRDDDE